MLLTPASAQVQNKEKRPIFAVLLKINVGAGVKTTKPWLEPQTKPLVNGAISKQNNAKTRISAKASKIQNAQATLHAKTFAHFFFGFESNLCVFEIYH
jgi:hypothetical protein